MRGLQIPLPGFDSRRRLQTGSSPRPAHPKAIQARMGHASITTTLDRYGHLYPDIDGDLADGLDLLRGAASPGSPEPTP